MTDPAVPKDSAASDDQKILDAYRVEDPEFAFILGGFRRIAVNPKDPRARKMLLRKGLRYFSRVQSFIFQCMNELPVDVFLDIGTNYGECAFALPLHPKARVFGYEANGSLHEYLARTKAYNDDVKTLTLVHSAVSNKAGEILTFYIDNAWSGKSSVVHDKKKKNQTKVEVKATSVDHEIERIGGPCDVLLMKVDVEGYEPAVFEGAGRTIRSVKNIVCLMEFDSKYMARGGADPEAFFYKLREDFEVYVADDVLRPVTQYAELDAESTGGPIHTNLVLARCGDPAVRELFRERVAAQNLRNVNAQVWR